jgi:Flp pilus assembly protein TadD
MRLILICRSGRSQGKAMTIEGCRVDDQMRAALDTFSFDVFNAIDDLAGKAKAQFDRGEFAAVLKTIQEIPELIRSKPETLRMKAESHQKLNQFAEAIDAWETLGRIDPGNAAAQTQLPLCYAKLGFEEVFREACIAFRAGKSKETISLLEAGAASWHSHPDFLWMMAFSHERLGNLPAALEAWRKVAAISPRNQGARIRIPVCLALLGELEAAGDGFRAAAESFPKSMAAQFNWLSFRLKRNPTRDELKLALLDATRLQAVSSNSSEFRQQLDNFRTKLLSIFDPSELLELDTGHVLQLGSVATGASGSLRLIYEQFEPIGNNCEFGLVQRRHGAEPLALFRWTGIAPHNLVKLLSDRLENFDAPERYRIEPNAQLEYLLKEDVYGTDSITLISVSQADPDELLRKLTRRQSFLKRKFLETAAEGSKIFVFKCDWQLPAETIETIEDMLHALGARRFLFVLPAKQPHLGGTTRLESEHRIIGFLTDFHPNIQFEQWDSIVQRTHAHFFPQTTS